MIQAPQSGVGRVAGALDDVDCRWRRRRSRQLGEGIELLGIRVSGRGGVWRRCGAIGMTRHQALSDVAIVRHTAIRLWVGGLSWQAFGVDRDSSGSVLGGRRRAVWLPRVVVDEDSEVMLMRLHGASAGDFAFAPGNERGKVTSVPRSGSFGRRWKRDKRVRYVEQEKEEREICSCSSGGIAMLRSHHNGQDVEL